MSNPQSSNHSPFIAYPASSLCNESVNDPVDYSYYEYPSGESRSSSLIWNQVASSSQACLPSDLPDLYYDQNWPSPHSATSSNMIATPPPDWQAPWQLTESQCISNNPPYMYSPWQASSLSPREVAHPTVAPIDTNCNRKDYQQEVAEHPSILLAPYDDFGSTQPNSSPYFQTSFNNNGIIGSGLSPSTLSSSPLSTDTSPSALVEPSPTSSSCPPHLPLKLHQPRPFRRIPIVSLSKLASACDDLPIPFHSKESNPRNVPEVHLDFGARSSISSFAAASQPSSHQFNKQHFYPASNLHTSTLAGTSGSKAIMCPCGCMGSHTFRY